MYLNKGEISKTIKFSLLDECALLIACIIHDYKHPGVTNNFLIQTNDPVAIKYNGKINCYLLIYLDVSVLENFHVAEAFKIIRTNENCEIFNVLNKDEYKVMRKRIIECVLATDMTFHAKQFTYLKLKIEQLDIKNGSNSDLIAENLDSIQLYATQQEFLNVMIHAADISNTTKQSDIYVQWVDRVIEEFWLQGDKEKSLNLPISFLCDRTTVTKHDSQLGFMDGITIPFFTQIIEIFPKLSFLMDNLNLNKILYKKIKDEYLKLDKK